jgi:hypothetical protein
MPAIIEIPKIKPEIMDIERRLLRQIDNNDEKK